jgi:hypothetical protein
MRSVLATHENPVIALMKLKATISKIGDWVKKWRIKLNQSKVTHITFTLRDQTCPTVQKGNVDLPQKNEVKYLAMHLDRRMTCAKHIKSKRKDLNIKVKQMNWLVGRSTLSIESKLLLYKAVLILIWTYGIQLRGTVSNCNNEILQCFQSKTLQSILNAPWYVNNCRIHEDLQMNTVLSEIKKGNTKYLRKLENHTNALAVNLLDNSETTHRLKRYTVLTVPDRPE